MNNEDKVTIKKTGDNFSTLCDIENLSIKHNGKEIPELKSIHISMELEEVITAHVKILDCNLDLENIPFEVKVDELHARILLKKMMRIIDGESAAVDYQSEMGPLLDQAREMTKDMPDIADVTTRDGDGFRQNMRTD